jgi:UDP-N-acetylmuramoylalanine--D-glutamate ligase
MPPHPTTAATGQLPLFDPAGRHVLVLGLGESGCAMARWCEACGASLRLADTRHERSDLLGGPARQLAERHQFVGGLFDPAWLDGVDLVCWSPGLSIELGDSSGFFALACERGIPVAGELDLFIAGIAGRAESGYRPRIIAITGTNGKTTTTALTARLLQACGIETRAAGNIGPAMLDALADALAAEHLPAIWVLELSSFQLALTQGFEPDVATVLNLSPDHQDWHASLASYLAAKRRVLGPATWMVSNRADPATSPDPVAAPAPEKQRGRRRQTIALRRASSFGLDRPREPGDLGIVRDGALAWLAIGEADESIEGGRVAGEPISLSLRRLMPAEALRIQGAHNHQNALAALALGLAVGAPLAPMLRALREYRGEPHRCQLIARVAEVDYFDDSKGTNVGASVAAIDGLARPLVLIAGGEGKGQDFGPLAPAVTRHARAVLLIGRDASLIGQALAATGRSIEYCDSLEAAVSRAATIAQPGEAVLLSPACASFDMFRSYVHRGEVFAALVQRLADEAGTPMEVLC